MGQRNFVLMLASTGVVSLTCCTSVKFAEYPPRPPGYGPYTLLIENTPHDVYSSNVVQSNLVAAILGKPGIWTLLTLEPPTRKSGWLAAQVRNQESWQHLSSYGYGVSVLQVEATASIRSHEMRGVPAYTPQHWWLVGVKPLRLAAYRYQPGEEVDLYGEDENGHMIYGARGFTCAEVFLVGADDWDRPVEAVAVYTGELNTDGVEVSGEFRIEQDKLDVRLRDNEFTIRELIEQYSSHSQRQ